MANKKGEDGVWRRCGQEDKLCPVGFCCFLGENVSPNLWFQFHLEISTFLFEEGGWNLLNFKTA